MVCGSLKARSLRERLIGSISSSDHELNQPKRPLPLKSHSHPLVIGMLRSQYGVATSSSVTPTASHAEDAQPNEVIYKRRHGLPPQIGSTWKNNYRGSGIQRGGYRGLSTEYGMRGNVSQRRRGNFQPNRGHQPSHISNSGRNVGSVISQSVYEGSSTVHPPHSAEPLVQVKTVISSTVPNILAETSSVKNEPRTPSPSTSRIERTLITSSCKFYPIPEFCKKTFPEFKENRDAFFREKMQELTRLGLTKVKSFFRYDPKSPRCTYQSLTLHLGMMALRSSGMVSRRTSLPILFTFLQEE